MEHLTYDVVIYNGDETFENEVDYLQYGTLEEMLNFIDEYRGYCASIRTIKNGEEIDKQTINI